MIQRTSYNNAVLDCSPGADFAVCAYWQRREEDDERGVMQKSLLTGRVRTHK